MEYFSSIIVIVVVNSSRAIDKRAKQLGVCMYVCACPKEGRERQFILIVVVVMRRVKSVSYRIAAGV